MIKKRIRYQGTDGMVEEDFYFHLSKVDLLAMEAKHEKIGGIKGYYEKVMASGDSEQALDLVKWFIVSSYGERTEQGRHLKNERLREEFVGGDAFSELFLELGQDADKAAQFINGLVPADLAAEVAKMTEQQRAAAMGPRPAVTQSNVFEKESAPDAPNLRTSIREEIDTLPPEQGGPEPAGYVPTESMASPPEGALGTTPAARTITKAEAEEMDAHELQRGLIEGKITIASNELS
jgi:hypothetical protein